MKKTKRQQEQEEDNDECELHEKEILEEIYASSIGEHQNSYFTQYINGISK